MISVGKNTKILGISQHLRKKIGIGIVGIFLIGWAIPRVLPIYLKEIPFSSVIYDRNHQEIGEILYDDTHRHQRLPYENYPKFITQGMVIIEDKRFWSHVGIDFYAIIRALFENIKSDSTVQGASTLPSQIARNQLWLNKPRAWRRKVIEFAYGYVLDLRYSKQELLEYYLNTMPLGYMNYGFETAAQWYFGKSVYQLSQEQQLALMTIAKNAVRYDPFKKQENFASRYIMLAKMLLPEEKISETSFDFKALGRKENHDLQQPYVRDFIKKSLPENQKNPQINTTIDDTMAREIKEIADQTIYKLQRKNVSDYGVIVIDKETNELLVMLGGMFYDGKAGQVNATTSKNQPGSAVKPFTYALAFQELGLKGDDAIIDEPVQFQSLLGYAYTPQNFSLSYQGKVTLASALAQSLNVPAVKVAEQLGAEKLLDFYHKVGLNSLNQSADHYGLALTLGVGEVSLRELTRAYGIFYHQGQLCNIVTFLGDVKQCEQIIAKKYTDMIVDILSNRYNRMPTFPMYSNLDFPDRNVFLKSGTSRKFSDNRVVGFTDHYVIGVRVGNKDGSNMKGVSGASGAGDIFNNIVYYLEKESQTPPYLPLQPVQNTQYLQITKPLPNSLYKRDSNIPQSLQGIKFSYKTSISHTTHTWLLNDQKVGDLRTPKSGSYTLVLQLFSGENKVGEEKVRFDVE